MRAGVETARRPAGLAAHALLTAALSAAPTGCADRAHVELPELPATVQSWLVARVGGDGQVRVSAADPTAPAIEIPVSEGAVALELRAFEVSLATLQLAVGPVPAAAPGEPSAALPAGVLTQRAELTGAVASPWTDGALEDVQRFQRRVSTGCGTFTTTVASLPSSGHVSWVQSIDGRTVLLGTASYDTVLVEVGQPARTVAVRSPTPALLESAFRDERGALWLGDRGGGLWRGRLTGLELTLEPVVGPSNVGRIEALDGDPSAPEAQLFAITSSGAVVRLAGDRFDEIDRFALGFETGGYAFTLAWLGRDDLLHAHSGSAAVLRWRNGGTTSEALNSGGAGVMSLDHFPDGRVAASMGSGLIAVFDRTTGWERFERAPISLDIRVSYAIEGGFVYAGAYGYVGLWRAEEGFCPIQEMPLAPHSVFFIRPFGERMIALGETRSVFPRTPYMVFELE